MPAPPDFSSRHTLAVEHRRRVELLRLAAEAAEAPDASDDDPGSLVDPSIAVRLAARLKTAPRARAGAAADEELQYAMAAGPVLMKYYDLQGGDGDAPGAAAPPSSILRYFIPNTADPAPDSGTKAQLMREYELATKADPAAGALAAARCACCGSADVALVAAEAVVVCRQCDACEPVVVETERPPSKDTVKDSAAFCYKRLNHFNEWLNQIQGKQQTNIPAEVYDAILLELRKRRIVNLNELTAAQVKEILKKLEYNKWYEHVTFILNRLSDRKPRELHPELEDQLRSMFRQIQAPFIKHAPTNRTNFLSYSYVLHKQVELLGRYEYLDSFPLLKSREKLQQQDAIWSNICRELGWEFQPSL